MHVSPSAEENISGACIIMASAELSTAKGEGLTKREDVALLQKRPICRIFADGALGRLASIKGTQLYIAQHRRRT